jgi:glycosyltransferase involved in cell wall biosynthesis
MKNILIVDIKSTLPAKYYGGTERVIFDLGKALSKKKYNVSYLIKAGKNIDFAEIIIFDHNKPIIEQVPNNIDLIHFHCLTDFKNIKTPYVFTMHGNGQEFEKFDINTIFLSKNHAERHNAQCYVYNGLDWSNYPQVDLYHNRTYFHFLGKASWKIKNLLGACKISVKAKVKLKVMGGNKWTFKNIKKGAYYKLNTAVEYMGMVDNDEKIKIMNNSKGLIFIVLWNEPFGLAIIESLYAGSPVFGSNYGSIPELLNPKVGYVSNSINDIVDQINTRTFSPKDCHEYAVENFSSDIMAKNYIKCYQKVLNGETLNRTQPKAISKNINLIK